MKNEPFAIFLYSLIVERQKNIRRSGPFDIFLSMLAIDKKITAKVNAFILPDGEVDLNFQKGD